MLYFPAALLPYVRATFLFFVCLLSKSVSAQCGNSFFISLTGDACTGGMLTATTNLLPATIVWKRDGVEEFSFQLVATPVGFTVAGGKGAGRAANQFSSPNRLFVDSEGNIYVPDMENNRVQKWIPGATEGITVAGGKGAGYASDQLNQPASVFVDKGGNMYITEQNNRRVSKWAPGASQGTTILSSLKLPTCAKRRWKK